jgi:hypothetical protein
MADLTRPQMQIAHIVAADLTRPRRDQLLAMAALFRKLGLRQLVIAAPEAELDAALRDAGVDCHPHHFGRLFDLKAEKAIQHELAAFAPHILQSHSSAAARFVTDHLKAWEPIHAAFTDAMPANVTAALRLHPYSSARTAERGRFVVVPPVSQELPETAKPYLLAYKTLLAPQAGS